MLELAYPLLLLAAPLPLLVWWLLPPQRVQVTALRVPFFARIVDAAGTQASPGAVIMRGQRLQMLVASVIWLLLVFALSKPQWVGEPIVRTEAARDVMLAIDLSASMDYRDFPGADGAVISRFGAVQQVVKRFVAARSSDRIGLIVFGSRAYLQLPFTRDLATATQLVDLMAVGMAGPKTALGDAIGLSLHAFGDSAVRERLLILLTDGNDSASRMTPLNAAAIAALQGVTIYTIGIGDLDASGEDRVDFATLQAIAERSGGGFYNAENTRALEDVYRRIDASASADVRTQSWRPRDSLVHWPAGLAAALALLTYGLLLFSAARAEARS